MIESTVKKARSWLLDNRGLLAACGLLLAVALLPRIINLTGHSIFVDEVKWHGRARLLSHAFRTGNIDALRVGWWSFGDTVAIGLPVTFLMALSRFVLVPRFSQLFAFRLPIAVVGSLTPLVFYLILRRAKKPEIGFVGALFLALEPAFVAMSRWSHQDVMLTFLFLVSIGSYYLGETEDRFGFKIASAAFFALAFLTKLGALAIPVIIVGWKLLRHLMSTEGSERFRVGKIFGARELVLPLVSLVLIASLWPALWGNPFGVLTSYLQGQANAVSTFGHRNLFMGQVTANPPVYYYIVILLIRLSPLALLAIGFSLATVVRKKTRQSLDDLWWLALLWIVTYVGLMSMSPKKLEVRYVLPVWPALSFMVAHGLQEGLRVFPNVGKRLAMSISTCLVVLFLLPVLLVYSPNYYLYYNSLVGGPAGVQRSKLSLMGVGEASRPLALFLQRHFAGKPVAIAHYGHPQPIKLYLTKSLARRVASNFPLTPGARRIDSYDLLRKIDTHNFDVIVLESHWIDRGNGPTVKQVLETGQFRLVYTSRMAGTELGWILVRK